MKSKIFDVAATTDFQDVDLTIDGPNETKLVPVGVDVINSVAAEATIILLTTKEEAAFPSSSPNFEGYTIPPSTGDTPVPLPRTGQGHSVAKVKVASGSGSVKLLAHNYQPLADPTIGADPTLGVPPS